MLARAFDGRLIWHSQIIWHGGDQQQHEGSTLRLRRAGSGRSTRRKAESPANPQQQGVPASVAARLLWACTQVERRASTPAQLGMGHGELLAARRGNLNVHQ